jgi:ribosomal protein S18 acetylase RimI-like enzyme
VRSGNRRAIALYERLGYRWCGTHRGYYRNGEDGLIMQKLIGLPGARAGATGAASPRPLN